MDDFPYPDESAADDAFASDPSLEGAAMSDATAGWTETPEWWQPAADVTECCCGPVADAPATLAFPMPDGTVLDLPAEDSGTGRIDRVPLDLNQDGVADAWAYDSLGTGQVSTMLLDIDGDGIADASSELTPTGWSAATPLTTIDTATAPAPAAPAPAAPEPAAPAATAPAPTPPASTAPAFVPSNPAADTDSDGDGRSDAIDAWPRDPYDSSSRDRDGDGTSDAFDPQPTQPFASATDDEDRDGTNDRFDPQPTQPFASSTADDDRDGTNDRFDSSPTNPYEDD